MKRILSKFLSSNWTVTLVATTIGVFLGIFMNDYFSSREETRKAKLAFQDVLEEMSKNSQLLIEWDSVSQVNYSFFEFMTENMNEEEELELVMTISQMDSLRSQYPGFLSLDDSTLVRKDTFSYHGEFSLNLNSLLLLIDHNEIAWTAIKNTDHLRHIEFECIKTFEEFYKLFGASGEMRKKWMDKLFFSPELYEDQENILDMILREWQSENQINTMLIDMYKQSQGGGDPCIRK